MKKNIIYIFFIFTVFFCYNKTVAKPEAAEKQEVETIIKESLNQILTYIRVNKVVTQDKKINQIIEKKIIKLLDLDSIVKNVFTKNYTKASPNSIAKFKQIFKTRFINIYGNMLIKYAHNHNFRILPSKFIRKNQILVNIDIYETDNSENEHNTLSYNMIKANNNNNWKINNFLMNGINLVNIIKDKFNNEMQKKNNNIDETILSFSSSTEVEEI